MLRDALKNLIAHRRRLMATAIAVMLGVSFMAGTLVLTDTVTHTFNSLFATVYKGTDAVVREQSAFSGVQNTGAQRGRVSPPGITGGSFMLGIIQGCKMTLASGRASFSWTSRAPTTPTLATSTASSPFASSAKSAYCRSRN